MNWFIAPDCLCRLSRHRGLTFAVTTMVALLTGCGGGSDSGAGTSTPSNPQGQPATTGEPSNNNPAAGFYGGSVAISVTGAGSDFVVRLRIVVDPGGGVAVFENGVLRAQARIVGTDFIAEANGGQEVLSGTTCTVNRRYAGSVRGSNASIHGTYTGEFVCADATQRRQRGNLVLPRTGDHQ